MGRHKKVVMDRLTINTCNATKLGMSYGKYMAMKYNPDLPKPQDNSDKIKCICCGKEIRLRNARKRKYCGDECREQYYRDIKERVPAAHHMKTCEFCGKEFEALSHNAKYCSDTCRKISKSQYLHDYHVRKLGRADG